MDGLESRQIKAEAQIPSEIRLRRRSKVAAYAWLTSVQEEEDVAVSELILAESTGFSEIRAFSNNRSLRSKPLTSFSPTARIRAGGSSVSPWKAVPLHEVLWREPAQRLRLPQAL